MQLRDFDVNLLTFMEAIWSTRSVSLAARRLNLAQSTVSATLNRLRQQLDDDIFVWNGHEMAPTPLTEQLMPEVSEILAGVRALLGRARGRRDDVERRLVIATADYVAALFGPALINRMMVEAPALTLDFVDIKPQFINKSSLPDIDLFIFPQDALRISGLNHVHLYDDDYVCIASVDNAALTEGMDPRAFMELAHVGYSAVPRTVFSHESILWDGLDYAPNYKIMMADYMAFLRIVSLSKAVAIVPGRMAEAASSQASIKSVAPPIPLPHIAISMAWKPSQDQDPAHAWLRKTLVDISAETATP